MDNFDINDVKCLRIACLELALTEVANSGLRVDENRVRSIASANERYITTGNINTKDTVIENV